ncbi:MAG: hypothetical protein ACREVH_03500 [Gammaproteobacteria bacterium]
MAFGWRLCNLPALTPAQIINRILFGRLSPASASPRIKRATLSGSVFITLE